MFWDCEDPDHTGCRGSRASEIFMSYSLNSFGWGCVGDYIREYYRATGGY